MNKEEIEQSLKEKFDDPYTIKMFTNFVSEFQECFSEMMSTEELINRVKNNIFGNIMIVEKFDNEDMDGQYSKDGYIKLKKSSIENERYIEYLLFHEMLHAVTSIRDKDGNQEMLGFSYVTHSYGKGLNEAMTEYLTQVRNERCEKNSNDLVSGYRTIVEQMRRLFLVTDKKKIIEAYFYHPQSLNHVLENYHMNYDEIELAFRELCGEDEEIYSMGHRKKLFDLRSFRLSKSAEMIFNNYVRAIGKVNTVEDFNHKYKIFQTYADGDYDCIGIMYIKYFNSIGKDIDMLIRNGESFSRIKEVVDGLKIDLGTLFKMYQFSKCFEEDKTESAIRLYEYDKKDHELYKTFFYLSYAEICNYFKETEIAPRDEELYSPQIYPLIGLLLKQHPEIDYSDVSYDHVREENMKLDMYVFRTSDNKRYAYMSDGRNVKKHVDKEDNTSFILDVNDICTCQISYTKEGKIGYSLDAHNEYDLNQLIEKLNFNIFHHFSEIEDMDYLLKEGKDTKEDLDEKLKKTRQRIKERGMKHYE